MWSLCPLHPLGSGGSGGEGGVIVVDVCAQKAEKAVPRFELELPDSESGVITTTLHRHFDCLSQRRHAEFVSLLYCNFWLDTGQR